uniref:Putative zinc finger protein n=1 Tax=Ixodes ricinus TaxID=34613 RepID=A0A0K8R4T1_IXORI
MPQQCCLPCLCTRSCSDSLSLRVNVRQHFVQGNGRTGPPRCTLMCTASRSAVLKDRSQHEHANSSAPPPSSPNMAGLRNSVGIRSLVQVTTSGSPKSRYVTKFVGFG